MGDVISAGRYAGVTVRGVGPEQLGLNIPSDTNKIIPLSVSRVVTLTGAPFEIHSSNFTLFEIKRPCLTR